MAESLHVTGCVRQQFDKNSMRALLGKRWAACRCDDAVSVACSCLQPVSASEDRREKGAVERQSCWDNVGVEGFLGRGSVENACRVLPRRTFMLMKSVGFCGRRLRRRSVGRPASISG